jgi:hypothetical protein
VIPLITMRQSNEPHRGMCAHPASRCSAVAEASGLGVLTASLLVDVVDLTTAAILGSVGLDTVEVRRTAAVIWGER